LFLYFISGFRRDVNDIYVLLGYYTASSGNCYPSFRDNVSVPSSRVKSPVKMEPICYPETSLNNYHTTPSNIPEERSSLSASSVDKYDGCSISAWALGQNVS
jgi:hypothetical protein